MIMPNVICLTPVKNEAWILERFLVCASIWADYIIVADQGSDDGSREIARRFPKVLLIENEAKEFNEPERQKLLIDAARRIPGQNLLIALDADEFLTANFSTSSEWEMVLRAVPGTVIKFQWACVLPDRKSYYIFPAEFALGFMDDGTEHGGELIHSPRLPLPEGTARISLSAIKVLHLSTIDWARFTSKVRWYQAWEFLHERWNKRLVPLYRFYHACFCIPPDQIVDLPPEWTDGYGADINILDVPSEPFYRWDLEMIRLFGEYGTGKFKRLDLWDVDWDAMHRLIFQSKPLKPIIDPRSGFDRWVHSRLGKTQRFYALFPPQLSRGDRYFERVFQKVVSLAGW